MADLISRKALIKAIGETFDLMRKDLRVDPHKLVDLVFYAPDVKIASINNDAESCHGCAWGEMGRYHKCTSCCRRPYKPDHYRPIQEET